MGEAQVGDGAPQSMHFWFAGADFWILVSCAFASSTGMSAAMAPLVQQRAIRCGQAEQGSSVFFARRDDTWGQG